jgi:2-polyprenyl-6-methoxyphenol hydroxylase-like FAD-dependent oxidoreductase
MKVVVVGGGIGGLCATIALRRAGIEVIVIEQAPVLREVGAGLTLWPNAYTALSRLDIADAVWAAGAAAGALDLRTAQGRLLVRYQARDAPFLAIHRADLQDVLARAAGEEAVRLGVTCTGFVDDGLAVAARLADGSEERGDALVGADGINSRICAQLFPKARPRYAGYVTWRGVADDSAGSVAGGAITESWGPGSVFGFGRVAGGRAYWYATKNAPPGQSDPPEGRKQEILERLRGFTEPAQTLIAATDETTIVRNDIFDRRPLRRWSVGRATLLGDAAHPMTPNLGQGAGQAMEDAVVLADCLRSCRDLPSALRAYESRRIGRTRMVVRESRRTGRLVQMDGRLARGGRDLVFRSVPTRLQRRRLDAIFNVEL